MEYFISSKKQRQKKSFGLIKHDILDSLSWVSTSGEQTKKLLHILKSYFEMLADIVTTALIDAGYALLHLCQ